MGFSQEQWFSKLMWFSLKVLKLELTWFSRGCSKGQIAWREHRLWTNPCWFSVRGIFPERRSGSKMVQVFVIAPVNFPLFWILKLGELHWWRFKKSIIVEPPLPFFEPSPLNFPLFWKKHWNKGKFHYRPTKKASLLILPQNRRRIHWRCYFLCYHQWTSLILRKLKTRGSSLMVRKKEHHCRTSLRSERFNLLTFWRLFATLKGKITGKITFTENL